MVPSITRVLSAASSAISAITAPGGRGRMVKLVTVSVCNLLTFILPAGSVVVFISLT
jgi:hypothetical protein